MIPYILIIIGILLTGIAVVGFIRLLLLPFVRMNEVIFEREDDFLKYESREGKKFFKRNLKQWTWVHVICLFVGVLCFFLGMYLGYAAKGDSFWFYKQIFGEDNRAEYWDKISEDGKFIADDGTEYTYYILVSGENYIFSGTECAGFEELKSNVESIRRENTVILIDSFAVSSKYHAAEKLLKELGIKYETEEE